MQVPHQLYASSHHYHFSTSPFFGSWLLTTLSQFNKQSGSYACFKRLIASTVLVPSSCSR